LKISICQHVAEKQSIVSSKQSIVSSKQSIVSSLTALWKNWINSSILSDCYRSQLWKDSESIKLSWKPDYVLEEVTVEPSGVQALKNPNPLKDVEGLVVLVIAELS